MSGLQKIFQEKWMNIPNFLSILRVLMVGPFIYLAHLQDTQQNVLIPLIAIILFIGFTDFMDGLIARRFQLKTTLGTFLDPIADKFVITVSLIVMVFYFHFPIWILVIYLLRELMMIYVSTMLFKRKIISTPNIWGKCAVALMITLLPIYLLRYTFIDSYPHLETIATIFAYTWFTCYFLSGIHYWQRFGDKLVQKKK